MRIAASRETEEGVGRIPTAIHDRRVGKPTIRTKGRWLQIAAAAFLRPASLQCAKVIPDRFQNRTMKAYRVPFAIKLAWAKTPFMSVQMLAAVDPFMTNKPAAAMTKQLTRIVKSVRSCPCSSVQKVRSASPQVAFRSENPRLSVRMP